MQNKLTNTKILVKYKSFIWFCIQTNCTEVYLQLILTAPNFNSEIVEQCQINRLITIYKMTTHLTKY